MRDSEIKTLSITKGALFMSRNGLQSVCVPRCSLK
nr:MAG TPA: hypothetical protein [Caudoviricetes sp.]